MARLDRAIQPPRVRAAKGGARLRPFVSDEAQVRHAVLLRSFKCAPNRLIGCLGIRQEADFRLRLLSRCGFPMSIERFGIRDWLAVPDVGSIAKYAYPDHVARGLISLTRTTGQCEKKN